MKNTQTTTPASEALIDYILKLTPAQCAKLVERLPLREQVASMTDNEQIFAEVFLSRVCGKVSA